MISKLSDIRNVPVSSAVISSLYSGVKTKWKKTEQLEKAGEIIRLKRNMYVVNPDMTGVRLSAGLIANQLLAPSYVSMSSALRYYGLIPEAVYAVQSMTFKPKKTFVTPVGCFHYVHTSREAYPVGLLQVSENGVTYIMASPEKALCDLVANTHGLTLRFKKEARAFLEEDLRLDMERFAAFDKDILRAYAEVGKKPASIRTLLKLLGDE